MTSSYKKRIEKKLASLSVAITPKVLASVAKAKKTGTSINAIYGDTEWEVTHFYYGHKQCELCGHNPIKRIFIIKSKSTGKTLEIGSECVKNYLDADLVKGLCSLFDIEYRKIVNPERFAEEVKVLEWACENKEVYRYRSLYYVFVKLVNLGNPAKLLRKIREGKNITAKEKEAFEVWKKIYNNFEVVTALEQVHKDIEEKKRQQWWKEYRERLRKEREECERREREERERRERERKEREERERKEREDKEIIVDYKRLRSVFNILYGNRSKLTQEQLKTLNRSYAYFKRYAGLYKVYVEKLEEYANEFTS